MLKKVFLLTQFGPPHPWSEQYLAHIRTLARYGFSWKIFTPHRYESHGNVEIIPMAFNEFDRLISFKTGIPTLNFLGSDGLPVKLTSDYYPAFGHIFEDYLSGCDYWSITNWDVVFGRLDHFLSDSELRKYDIWSDDCGHINSLFCFYENVDRINFLYTNVPGWRESFQFDGRRITGFDEIAFDAYIRARARAPNSLNLHFGHPPYFALHSYDRLIQHQPFPNLSLAPDGALFECFDDSRNADLQHYPPWQGFFGREIMYFHFIQTKQWPKFRPYPCTKPSPSVESAAVHA